MSILKEIMFAVLLLSIFLAAYYALNNAVAMSECQKTHSYATCKNLLR